VISATSYTLLSVIPVGTGPFGVATDSATQEVFVTNGGSDNVSVISGSTPHVVANIGVQTDPRGIAVDLTDGSVYVADNGSSHVSVIDVSTLSVVATISVGSNPLGVAWDAATDRIFVADGGSDQVSVLQGSSQSVSATVPVGSNPYGVAVDNASDAVYVSNQGSRNVSVISASTGRLIAAVPVGPTTGSITLQGIAYDSVHRVVWVGAGSVFAVVINTTSEAVMDYVTTDPAGVAFDPDNGNICVTNTANFTFACFVFRGAFFPSYSPASVTFSEGGLPVGTPWSVTLETPRGSNVTQVSNTSSISFEVFTWFDTPAAYNYSYLVGQVIGYLANPAAGFAASLTGANVTQGIAFSSTPGAYPVSFVETGLAAATNWSILLDQARQFSTTKVIVFAVGNGSHPFTVESVQGYGSNVSGGTASVAGSPVVVEIDYTASVVKTYFVEFNELGLPNGTSWSVTLNGSPASSSSRSILFSESNGTYSFSVGFVGNRTSSPSSGNLTVSGGTVVIPIAFVYGYQLSFIRPVGILNGSNWSVTLTGVNLSSLVTASPLSVTKASTGSIISFREPNGTYSFQVSASAYPEYGGSGSTTVHGSATTVTPPFLRSTSASAGVTTQLYVVYGAIGGLAAFLAIISVMVAAKARRPPG